MTSGRTSAAGPDFGVVAGAGTLADAVGAALTIVLVASVACLIVSAVAWALGEAGGNWQLAAKAKTGLVAAVVAASLSGAGVAWANFLIDVGGRL
ncbi:MAG: DUF6112 family protein [Bifidobacteriaceae bacterium]|nr:DUF6112 family protein [Bifidobacteriaceae bacterium]